MLVNNAGGGFRAAFLDVNDKGQDSLVRENFTSVTNFVRAAVPLMPADGHASIVNITSIEAHRAGPGFAIYSAMKAALVNLTKSLALELGERRIRVNCIAPDVIPTPGIGGELPGEDAAARRRPRRRRRRRGRSTSRPISGASSPAPRSTSTAATSPRADGGERGDGSWITAGEVRPTDSVDEEVVVKFGVALGALNPHFHLDATMAAEELGYESVWLPGAPRSSRGR